MDRHRIGKLGKKSDGISQIPDNVVDEILAKLPIQEAVRTSILSRDWRYKWITVPDLCFEFTSDESQDIDRLIKVIYRVLCQHKGRIHKFSLLNVRNSMSLYPDIDQWIKSLLNNSVREFILDFVANNSDQYKIHSSLFSCRDIRELSLSRCVLSAPPPTFNGFKDLTSLKLYHVTVNNESFQNLISVCLQLKILELSFVNGLDGLHFDHTPNLHSMSFTGTQIRYICLKNAPSLFDVTMSISQMPPANGRSISLINNLNGLSNLRSFMASSFFLKFLAQDNVKKCLPSSFNHLWYLQVEMKFYDIDSVSSVLGLIKSSPNLTKLGFKFGTGRPNLEQLKRILDLMMACDTDVPNLEQLRRRLYLKARSNGRQNLQLRRHLDEQRPLMDYLMKLKYVEIKEFWGSLQEMSFIKLILEKSPSLEQMEIGHERLVNDLPRTSAYYTLLQQSWKELMRYPRASTTAEIIWGITSGGMENHLCTKKQGRLGNKEIQPNE